MALFTQMQELLETKALNSSFARVYMPAQYDEQYTRFLEVLKDFSDKFDPDKTRDVALFSAPGRTEVGGNHTDHNHGKVLAASISLDAIAVASKTDSGVVQIKSAGYPMDVVSCDDLEIKSAEYGRSVSLIRGMLARFKALGYQIGGFDATTASKVLSGSGLSSSAAFEVLVGTMINEMYNDGKVSSVEIAKIAQYAENVYFNKPCGLLDQMACSVGGFVSIDFADPANPVIQKIDFDFSACGYSLVIVDTLGSHSGLTDDYAAIRTEMEAVASQFGKKVLREISKSQVLDHAKTIAGKVSERAVLRALHFFNENTRVDKEVAALSAGDFDAFLRLVVESGYSSYMYNQNVFTSKFPLRQPLSMALAVSAELLGGKGAWRVHGGGFAGTIQAFVPNDLLDSYINAMQSLFSKDACYVLNIRPFGGVKLF